MRSRTKGASDLHMLQNTIAPGGTFGWRSHPGPSLVIVSPAARPSTRPMIPRTSALRRLVRPARAPPVVTGAARAGSRETHRDHLDGHVLVTRTADSSP
jgi:hypothetical protein